MKESVAHSGVEFTFCLLQVVVKEVVHRTRAPAEDPGGEGDENGDDADSAIDRAPDIVADFGHGRKSS